MMRLFYIFRALVHPNIVGFRGLPNTQDGRTALAMEVCDTSLGDRLEARHEGGAGPLEAKRIGKVIVYQFWSLHFNKTPFMYF